MGAYDKDPNNAFTYESYANCIERFCEILSNEYLNNGKQTIDEIRVTYTSDIEWGNKVRAIMREIDSSG
ncbi:hypothetical protein D3C73_1656590 [compost metagenome]